MSLISFTIEDPYQANFISYSTCLGGSNNDYGTGIMEGFVGIPGDRGNQLHGLSRGQLHPRPSGTYDVFLADVSRYGTYFSTLLGGTNDDYGNAFAKDHFGNIYVVGHTQSSDFPLSRPLYWGLRGASDAFVAKFNPRQAADEHLTGGLETTNSATASP